MSPTISDLFADDDEVDDRPLDLDTLMRETDAAIAASNKRQGSLEVKDSPGGASDDDAVPSTPPVEVRGDDEPVEPVTPSEPAEEEPEGEPVSVGVAPPPPAPDPLLETLRQAIADPKRAAKIFAALSEEEAPQPVAQLPEEIDPSSFEAQIWRDNQETKRMLAEIASGQRAQQEAFARNQASVAADAAGRSFAARYQGRLEDSDIMEIARATGQAGTAAAFAGLPQHAGNLQSAYEAAMENTLWSTPAWRDKALNVPPPQPPGEAPEAKDRKKKLGALSSGASPIAGPTEPVSPMETRADGRLTDKSRLTLVKSLAGQLRGANEGIAG